MCYGDYETVLSKGETVYFRCLGDFNMESMASGRSTYTVKDASEQEVKLEGAYEAVFSDVNYVYSAKKTGTYTFELSKNASDDVTFGVYSDYEGTSNLTSDSNIITVTRYLTAGERIYFSIKENDFAAAFNHVSGSYPYQLSMTFNSETSNDDEFELPDAPLDEDGYITIFSGAYSYSCSYSGDVNQDGSVDENDYMLLKEALKGLVELDGFMLANADLDCNDKVDVNDLVLLRRSLDLMA